jgi:hypothetical protein
MRARALLVIALGACNLPYPADVGPTDAPQGTIDAPPGTPDAMFADAPAGTIALALSTPHAYLHKGAMVSIGVTVTRGAGVTGDATVTVTSSPPTGVTFDPLTILDGSTTGTLVAHALTSTVIAENNLTVQASDDGHTDSAVIDLEVIGAAGDLDTAFGTSGTVLINPTALPVGIFTQGPKVVVLYGGNKLGLATSLEGERLLADGTTDSTFGASGTLAYQFSAIGISNLTLSAAEQTDGMFVIGGSGSNGSDQDPVIVRVTADGQLDPSLMPRRVDTSSTSDSIATTAVDTVHPTGDPDSIYLAGATSSGSGGPMMMRLTAQGAIDPSLGRLVPAGASGQFVSLVFDSDGTTMALSRPATLHRVQATGTFDSTYTGAMLGGATGIPWVEGIGLPNSTGLVMWGEQGGQAGAGTPSDFSIWFCVQTAIVSNCGSGAGSVYEGYVPPLSSRTNVLPTVLSLPDGSGYLGVGYDQDVMSPYMDFHIDLIELDTTGKPLPGVGTNGIARDTTAGFATIGATALSNHRVAVLAYDHNSSPAKLVVRRYFW